MWTSEILKFLAATRNSLHDPRSHYYSFGHLVSINYNAWPSHLVLRYPLFPLSRSALPLLPSPREWVIGLCGQHTWCNLHCTLQHMFPTTLSFHPWEVEVRCGCGCLTIVIVYLSSCSLLTGDPHSPQMGGYAWTLADIQPRVHSQFDTWPQSWPEDKQAKGVGCRISWECYQVLAWGDGIVPSPHANTW
jgi:hypothetical protein